MMKIETGRTVVLATATLALLWARTATDNALAASPYASPPPLTLNVKGPDLSRPEAVTVLYDRIVAASVQVCRPWNAESAGVKAAWDSCRDATVSHTVESLNLHLLTSYHLTKTGQSRKADLQANAR